MTLLEGTVLAADGSPLGEGLDIDNAGSIISIAREAASAGKSLKPAAGRWIVPGLIDIHCHGGGGGSFPDAETPEAIEAAIGVHRKAGTTAMLASLVSMIDPLPAIEALVPWCEAGDLLGIHMEGPYISPGKCGAQNPEAVRPPDLAELESWLKAGKGRIRTMTIAPEVPQAMEAARLLARYGAMPSWGHTSADAAQTRVVLEQCAAEGIGQTATHLFNAMPAMSHRAPGPVREFLASARRGECVVELVADGVHVALDLVGDVVRWCEASEDGALGYVFVTDAIAGAGLSDGGYVLGGLPVTMADGVAKLTGSDTIAGGSARLADEVARTVGHGSVCLSQAIRACVAGPAAVLGLSGSEPGVCLRFEPGTKLSCIVFDEELAVAEVWREGERVA